jgi:hypothetical protein
MRRIALEGAEKVIKDQGGMDTVSEWYDDLLLHRAAFDDRGHDLHAVTPRKPDTTDPAGSSKRD